jgi:hypothetical protein
MIARALRVADVVFTYAACFRRSVQRDRKSLP